MARRTRNRNTAAASTPKINFTALTTELEDVHFTHWNSKPAAEFGIVKSKLVRHKVSKDKGDIGSRAMEEMAHPTIVKPVKSI